jgi:hypothetical protein
MSWKCPSCGHQNYETSNYCVCGCKNDDISLVKHGPMSFQDVSEDIIRCLECLDVRPDSMSDPNPPLQGPLGTQESHPPERPDSMGSMPHEELIKEIDSWLFTFSRIDGCISISTPALQSFRLKVTVEDLEDLLEFLYRKTGSEKTIRKIGLEPTDIVEIIDRVDRMIEEKKSKVPLNFTNDELQEIVDIVNMQIKA